ncbi:MAG: F0F1 ATP synthase subunit A, partial [Rhodobacteraceae bacterium]|nr:F0F1 ATP synthase subunit A [Paracoccaceae bacterium]
MATETEAEKGLEIHPMDQFLIKPVLGDGPLVWYSFSNTAMWMAITLLGVIIFLVVGTRKKSYVPDRFQMVVELIYGFVRNMVQDVAGRDALPF